MFEDQLMAWHEYVRIWASVVILFGSLSWTVLWSLSVAKKSATKASSDAQEARIAKVEAAIADDKALDERNFGELKGRLQRVEDEIKHLPTREQVQNMQLAIGDVKADMREMAATMRPLLASVERIDNFLMDRGKG